MNGTIQHVRRTGATVHVYTPPDEFHANSIILELEDRLIVIDAQMARSSATEVADYVDTFDKRIDRFLLSHDHPDHYAGFTTLTQRFPGVQLAALPSVRQHLINVGERVLSVRRELFGDEVNTEVVVPDATVVPGNLTIGGLRFVFVEYDETESEHTLVIHLPDVGLCFPADLVTAGDEHMFTVQPNFDRWIDALHALRRDVARYGIDTLVPGHGNPVGIDVLPANIAYLEAAREVYAHSGTKEEYKAALKARLPQRGPQPWLDWVGEQLFGSVAP